MKSTLFSLMSFSSALASHKAYQMTRGSYEDVRIRPNCELHSLKQLGRNVTTVHEHIMPALLRRYRANF
jgi:hypothetical protein